MDFKFDRIVFSVVIAILFWSAKSRATSRSEMIKFAKCNGARTYLQNHASNQGIQLTNLSKDGINDYFQMTYIYNYSFTRPENVTVLFAEVRFIRPLAHYKILASIVVNTSLENHPKSILLGLNFTNTLNLNLISNGSLEIQFTSKLRKPNIQFEKIRTVLNRYSMSLVLCEVPGYPETFTEAPNIPETEQSTEINTITKSLRNTTEKFVYINTTTVETTNTTTIAVPAHTTTELENITAPFKPNSTTSFTSSFQEPNKTVATKAVTSTSDNQERNLTSTLKENNKLVTTEKLPIIQKYSTLKKIEKQGVVTTVKNKLTEPFTNITPYIIDFSKLGTTALYCITFICCFTIFFTIYFRYRSRENNKRKKKNQSV